MTEYGTPEEIWYMYRVESYLIYKYQPHLVDTMKFTFGRARLRREEVVVEHDTVLPNAQALHNAILRDLQSNVTWKPKKSSHKGDGIPRPGIGSKYQKKFNEL